MPTVFRKLGLRFYFVSFDFTGHLHIHVGDDASKICKFWIKEKLQHENIRKNYLVKS